MLGVEERQAISETLEILDYIDKKIINKIPQSFWLFLQENQDENYVRHIDKNKDLNLQISKKDTKAVLGIIFYNFVYDSEEKKEFTETLQKNEAKKQEELSKAYDYEDLFKNNKRQEEVHENLPIVTNTKWYKKIVNFFKGIFQKKK